MDDGPSIVIQLDSICSDCIFSEKRPQGCMDMVVGPVLCADFWIFVISSFVPGFPKE